VSVKRLKKKRGGDRRRKKSEEEKEGEEKRVDKLGREGIFFSSNSRSGNR
jgi:hypothetical protein